MPLPILAIGGATVDRTYICANPPSLATSNPVNCYRCFGGVARNVAETLARLGASVRLITAVGEDDGGRALANSFAESGIDMRGLMTVAGNSTAEYTAAFWDGELFAGFADMNIFDALTPDAVAGRLPKKLSDWLVFADCNLPAATLAMLAERTKSEGSQLVIDCVSLAKSQRLPADLSGVQVVMVNGDQIRHIAQREAIPEATRIVLGRGCCNLVLTLGANGLIIYDQKSETPFAAPKVSVVNVSGAGDSLTAGTLLGLSEARPLLDSIRYGLAATSLALQTFDTVPPDLTRQRLEAEMLRSMQNPGIPNGH
jgi:pseudouridine kinase